MDYSHTRLASLRRSHEYRLIAWAILVGAMLCFRCQPEQRKVVLKPAGAGSGPGNEVGGASQSPLGGGQDPVAPSPQTKGESGLSEVDLVVTNVGKCTEFDPNTLDCKVSPSP